MPISLITAVAADAPVAARADPPMDADRTPGGPRIRRAPETLVLGLGAVAVIVLVALAAGGGSLAAVWENGHWTLSAAVGLAAALLGRRGTTGVEWRSRTWAAAIVATFLIGQLCCDVLALLGIPTFPSVGDLFFLAGSIPLGGWIIAGLQARGDRTERWAGLIDGAAVVVAVLGVVAVMFGAVATAIGGFAGALLIAYPAIYVGGAGAALVVLLERSGRRAPWSALVMIGGLALFGVGWPLWMGATATGTHIGLGTPVGGLFSLAGLAIGVGAAIWPGPTAGERRGRTVQLGALVPIVTALAAALVIVSLDDQLNGISEPIVRLAVAATIVLIVVRQTLLLRERRATADRERSIASELALAVEQGRVATQRLADAEERFRRLVEQIPATVYLDRVDPARRSVVETMYISPRVEELTGFTQAEVANDNDLWINRIVEEDRPALVAAWDRHFGTGEPFSETFRFRRKDGIVVWIAEDATVLVNDEGEHFSQGMAVDVTERKETEARLRQAQKMEAVGQLAGGVAHDFNNLLTVITGHAGMLRETTSTDDPRREDVEAIATAAASSADLVGQLLAFGRRTMLRPEVVDVSGVVADVLPMLRRLLPEHIDVATALHEELPAVRADPSQLQQVVLNLAINGRDAMPAGGSLRIETGVRVVSAIEAARTLGLLAGRYVQLTIADEGVGMDAATRDRIFEPFFTTKAAGRGTGLGLATVYGIVKQSGGYISLDSAPDRGSTFRVLLPATNDEVPDRAGAPPSRTPSGRERIVLCEDEPAVRDLVASILRRSGYDVAVATTPSEALLLVADRSTPADLLLTDVVMPGMSGPDVARRARSLRPDLRVVLMSGYAADSRDQEALGRSAAFLAKPFTPTVLARTIRDVLDGGAGGETGGTDPRGGVAATA